MSSFVAAAGKGARPWAAEFLVGFSAPGVGEVKDRVVENFTRFAPNYVLLFFFVELAGLCVNPGALILTCVLSGVFYLLIFSDAFAGCGGPVRYTLAACVLFIAFGGVLNFSHDVVWPAGYLWAGLVFCHLLLKTEDARGSYKPFLGV
eukprot:TRINITY_DN48887_c0_g1_i1.p1 TRINITY_DN48887_c0_g1~~TRINITY_DN48887_c0_g1_i1.p1  ORF type:complete len:148 (+),score=24.63 TRINITY_DN48887_c0_g1_i1:82-525(+)